MINERVEVKQYLKGNNLSRRIEYRICLLLSKWFYEQGCTTVEAIRTQLIQWAKANNFYITIAMNPIAARVIRHHMKLLDYGPIKISHEDVSIIKKKFDSHMERLMALSLLCYGKAYADTKGEFKLSTSMLAIWLGINKITAKKYLAALEDMEYILPVEASNVNVWYQKEPVNTLNLYRINVPTRNAGPYILKENDIHQLYSEIFEGVDTSREVWYPIPGYNDWYQISDQRRVRVCQRTVGGRNYPAKVLRLSQKGNQSFAYLYDEKGKQRKISTAKLMDMVREA
ncbi:MAG: hypothetical protein HFE73_05215 [Firmicutes bacterium]|nr:hypothetical protein [Bacillota bacterium]